jgi:hypothetical protein
MYKYWMYGQNENGEISHVIIYDDDFQDTMYPYDNGGYHILDFIDIYEERNLNVALNTALFLKEVGWNIEEALEDKNDIEKYNKYREDIEKYLLLI